MVAGIVGNARNDLVWLRVWPWFASLRGEPRFERLVSAVGLGLRSDLSS